MNEEKPEKITPEGIALSFSERFQNNYPKEPIWQMMVDLEKEIKAYAEAENASLRAERDSLESLLKEWQDRSIEQTKRIVDLQQDNDTLKIERDEYRTQGEEYRAGLKLLREQLDKANETISLQEVKAVEMMVSKDLIIKKLTKRLHERENLDIED